MKFIFFVFWFIIVTVGTTAQLSQSIRTEVKTDSVRTLQCFSQQTSKGNLETRLFLYNDKLYLNWTLNKGGLKAGNLLIQFRDFLEIRGGVKLASISLDPDRICEQKYRSQFGFLGSINKAVREIIKKDEKANHLHRVVMLTFTENHIEDEDYIASCSYSPCDLAEVVQNKNCSEYLKKSENNYRSFSEEGRNICSAIPDWNQKQKCLMELRNHLLESYLSTLKNYFKCRSNLSKHGTSFIAPE